jgi:hypoxanthine phosphoribosyltransferase
MDDSADTRESLRAMLELLEAKALDTMLQGASPL